MTDQPPSLTTYARLQTLMLRAVEATPPKTRPLYPRGQEPTPAPPPRPLALLVKDAETLAKFWSRERCLECMSIVVVNASPHVWSCTNLACGRGGWLVTVGNRTVRVVDQREASDV